MSEELYDTPEKVSHAISSFTDLLRHPGWLLMEKILNANIEVVLDQLENGIEGEETKADIVRTRDKLKLLREIRDTPIKQIKALESPIEEEVNHDPFDDEESLQQEKGEAVTRKS